MAKETVDESTLEAQLEQAKKEKELYDLQCEIKDLKKSMKRRISTTKLIVAFIFINCSVVEVYSMVAMWMLNDLSALYTLISAVIGEAVAFAVYAAKAYNENKQEALVDLEYDKLNFQYEDSGEDDGEAQG